MEVYVLIWWSYDGDSNLVNSFEGVFSDYNKAENKKNELDPNNEREIINSEEAEKRTYKHSGYYGSPSYFEIRNCTV